MFNSHLAGDKAHRQRADNIENFWNRYQETQSSARILYLHNTVDCNADQVAIWGHTSTVVLIEHSDM